jgi:hypothetical protein
MMAAQLKETTMDPGKRTLLRVVLVDKEIKPTSRAVERLMGTKAEARFDFIQRRRNSPAQNCWTCNTQSVAGATFIALLQQRRFAAARDSDAVSDLHRTAKSA